MPDNPDLTALSEPEAVPAPRNFRVPRTDLLIALVLALVTIAAYARVWKANFVNFDDNSYVIDNPHIRGELTSETISWIFLSGYPDNWFPLTRLSHLIDYRLFGRHPLGHHLENVFWHIVAGLLLFAFLRRATHIRWPSAFVAAVFLIHPLHVESVAWISERKDVLCAVFWFATLLAWTRYAEQPSRRRYLLALFFFAMGIMSKPMIVTLPAIMILVDWWPLNRKLTWRQQLLEKAPFAMLAVFDAVATYLVQSDVGAVASLKEYSPLLRVENAIMTLVFYVEKTCWPSHLAILYPYPESIPWWEPFLASVAVCAATIFVYDSRKKYPWLAVGWLWYLVTLIPVIGIVQVGLQARADRYTYIPSVGVLIAFAWGTTEILRLLPKARVWAEAAGAATVVALAMTTSIQITFWYDTQALFGRSVVAVPNNHVGFEYLAEEFARNGDTLPDAITNYEAAIRIRPKFVEAHNGLGVAFSKMGLLDLAITKYREAIRLDPDYPPAHYDLGAALLSLNRANEAIPEFEKAVKINSFFFEAHNDLGAALLRVPGRQAEAVAHLRKAVSINPEYAIAQNNLGMAITNDPKHLGEAIEHFQKATRIDRRYVDAWVNLGIALLRDRNRTAEAIATLEYALRLKPDERLRQQLNRIEAAEAAKMRGQ